MKVVHFLAATARVVGATAFLAGSIAVGLAAGAVLLMLLLGWTR